MGRLWPVGWARKSCKDRKKCPFLTSFAQQYILRAQGYFGNHHPLKKWYWKKFQLFFSLVETLECYVALISSEMLLLWMKTKVKPFGYLFGTHGRGCVLTSSCCSLAMAEMLNWWNHGSNGDEPYRNQIFFYKNSWLWENGTCPVQWIEPMVLPRVPFISLHSQFHGSEAPCSLM